MKPKSRARRISTWVLGIIGCTLWVLGLPFLLGDRCAIPAAFVIFTWVGVTMYWRAQDQRDGRPSTR